MAHAEDTWRIAIVGAGGRLGAALQREYQGIGEVVGFNHHQLDLRAPDSLRQTLGALDFDLLINCAAQTNVDRCESERQEAFAINADAPGVLAKICSGKGARLIHISTDYVFDGEKIEPCTEEDEPNPISVYGASKLAGERIVLAQGDRHLVARVSWVFGPDRPSFIDWIVQQAREHERVQAVADKFSTPTLTRDIAGMLRPFFDREFAGGIVHIANRGRCSWQEYGQYALDCCLAEGMPLRARTVDPVPLAEMKNFVARRPVHSALSTARYEQLTGHTPRRWQEAVAEYARTHLTA